MERERICVLDEGYWPSHLGLASPHAVNWEVPAPVDLEPGPLSQNQCPQSVRLHVHEHQEFVL